MNIFIVKPISLKRKAIKIFCFSLGSLFLFMFLLNSHLQNSEKDKYYISLFLREWQLNDQVVSSHHSFENEIAFISKLQDSTLYDIEMGEVDPVNATSMEFYYSNRRGLCFNRAFFQEKVLKYAGYETRHVFIYFNENKNNMSTSDFLNKRLRSHAMFEVKTSKGWMAVETNSNWLALDKNNNPMTMADIQQRLAENRLDYAKAPTKGQIFYTEIPIHSNFKYMYGVYSRHGKYLSSGPVENMVGKNSILNFVPDYDLSEMRFNF